MDESRGLPAAGAIAVIFISMRTDADEDGYAEAASAMDSLARQQPGFIGIDSARGEDRLGITVSYWADERSAVAWRQNAEHAAVRALGRERWYAHYRLIVASVTRAYQWDGNTG